MIIIEKRSMKKGDNVKSVFSWLVKAFCAGCVAFFLLNFLCFGFSKLDAHITNPTGATDYVWTANSFFIQSGEGFSHGRFDENGFHNAFAPKSESIDYLLIGSSQMEAVNVGEKESTAYLLNEKLNLDNYSCEGGYLYNIGTSGHNFVCCVDNLHNAMAVYSPKKAVIIETMQLGFSEAEINAAVTHTRTRIPSYDGGLFFQLQKLPYLKLLYHQYKGLNRGAGDDISAATAEPNVQDTSLLLEEIVRCTEGKNALILFFPTMKLEENGTLSPSVSAQERATFASLCAQYGITFVDMTDTFLQAYEEEHILPYGFANTHVGQGHLNKNGHRMIAEKLYETICELEGVA